MSDRKILAGQLSSVHSAEAYLEPKRVREYIDALVKQVPLDIIILGWEERADLFTDLTQDKLSNEVFLWYPFLSDYPEMELSHLIMNYQSGQSTGWAGYAGSDIRETFKQACPNNPASVSTSLAHMERLLSQYDFDGVFIDKIRFPSMANGLKDVFSCFCPYCMEKAKTEGLDLEEVRQCLKYLSKWTAARKSDKMASQYPSGSEWLADLVEGFPILDKFIRFRIQSINEVVKKISDKTRRLKKKVSFDVFSPSLTTFVGQDLKFIASQADWVKPMIYRFGNGPSSLRTEIPMMIKEIQRYLGLDLEFLINWVGKQEKTLEGVSLAQLEKVAPLDLLRAETYKAVESLQSTQVYLGVETVHIPSLMEVQPRHVQEIIDNGMEADVHGYVLSWDLLHTPLENILPLQKII